MLRLSIPHQGLFILSLRVEKSIPEVRDILYSSYWGVDLIGTVTFQHFPSKVWVLRSRGLIPRHIGPISMSWSKTIKFSPNVLMLEPDTESRHKPPQKIIFRSKTTSIYHNSDIIPTPIVVPEWFINVISRAQFLLDVQTYFERTATYIYSEHDTIEFCPTDFWVLIPLSRTSVKFTSIWSFSVFL